MTSRLSDVPPCFDRLNDSYDDLVLALKREKEAQDADVRAAWLEIEQARQEIRSEWRRIDAEKSRLFPSASAAALPYTGHRTLDGGGRAHSDDDDDREYEHNGFAPTSSEAPRQSTSPLKRSVTATTSQRRHNAHAYDDRVSHLLTDGGGGGDAAGAGVVRSPSRGGGDLNTSGSNGAVVFVWNGIQRAAEPKRLALHPFRSMQQLLERAAQETMAMPAGELVAPDGRRIRNIADLQDRGDYLVLPSGCGYREEAVPTTLLRKLVKRDSGQHSGSTALRRHATA